MTSTKYLFKNSLAFLWRFYTVPRHSNFACQDRNMALVCVKVPVQPAS